MKAENYVQIPVYQVFMDDNFHYMDEGHRYAARKSFDYAAALAKAKEIVDGSLDDMWAVGSDVRASQGALQLLHHIA